MTTINHMANDSEKQHPNDFNFFYLHFGVCICSHSFQYYLSFLKMNFELDVFLLYTHCLQGFVHLKLCIYTVAFDQLPNRPVLYKDIENH